MEIREFCRRIVESPDLETKLSGPEGGLTDDSPGPALRLTSPARSTELRIQPASRARVPSLRGLQDPKQKVRIIHSLANHELQAVELFAWALLAFPGTPAEFRRDAVRILREEQMHTRLYVRRLESLGARLGDYPVSGYFWNKMRAVSTPAGFLSAMCLTFENANLDHSASYAEEARALGDEETAAILDRVHRDEIGHVRFGWTWLARLKDPEQTTTEAYLANVAWPLRPALARGDSFHEDARRSAGLDEEFVRLIERAER